MNLELAIEIFKKMIPALPRTLYITLIPFALAFLLALAITLIIYFKIPVLQNICKVIVSFFRGTPFIGQLFLIYFGLPKILPFLLDIGRVEAFVLTMTLNTAAYVSESLRGAVLSVDKGQIEAAKSIGLGNFMMMKNIVIPQAIPVAVPSLVNTLIDTIKGSSLAFSIGVVDITAMAQIQAGLTYQYFEAYMALVLLYWIVILLLECFQKQYERRLKKEYVES